MLILEFTINTLIVFYIYSYFTCEKQKLINFLLFFSIICAPSIYFILNGITSFYFKVIQEILIFIVAYIFLKGNWKQILCGNVFAMLIQHIGIMTFFLLYQLISDKLSIKFRYDLIISIISNIVLIFAFILIKNKINLENLKKLVFKRETTIIFCLYLFILNIIMYYQYYFLYGDFPNNFQTFFTILNILLSVILLIYILMKLKQEKTINDFHNEIYELEHENNRLKTNPLNKEEN